MIGWLVGWSVDRSSILNDGISRIRERLLGISSCQIHRRLFSRWARVSRRLLVPTNVTLVDETSLKVFAPFETVSILFYPRQDTSIFPCRCPSKEQLDGEKRCRGEGKGKKKGKKDRGNRKRERSSVVFPPLFPPFSRYRPCALRNISLKDESELKTGRSGGEGRR